MYLVSCSLVNFLWSPYYVTLYKKCTLLAIFVGVRNTSIWQQFSGEVFLFNRTRSQVYS